jgi:transposase-like protein
MTKQTRRRFSPDYKEEEVARLSEPGATHGSVAGELGITPTQLKTWRLELEAAGSGASIATQKAEAAELTQLRRDNKRLKEKVEVLRKANATGERVTQCNYACSTSSQLRKVARLDGRFAWPFLNGVWSRPVLTPVHTIVLNLTLSAGSCLVCTTSMPYEQSAGCRARS